MGCLSLMAQYSQYVSISCSNFARLCSSLLAAGPPLQLRCFLGGDPSVVDFDGEARFLRAGGELVDAAAEEEVLEEADDDEEEHGERTVMAVSASLGSLARFLYFRFVGAAGC